SNGASPVGDPQSAGAAPTRKTIRARLTELAAYGCDPSDHTDWLTLATSPEPRATKGRTDSEGFGIWETSTTYSSGNEPQLEAAYRAVRFIEDAGLPLSIPGTMTLTVANDLYRNAMETIAFFAPHEAVGLALRSRDQKLVQRVFTRARLATLSSAQVSGLL